MESLALPRCAACGRVPHAEVGWAADASPASGLSPGGGTRVDSLVHARAEEDARAAADRAAEATVSRGLARWKAGTPCFKEWFATPLRIVSKRVIYILHDVKIVFYTLYNVEKCRTLLAEEDARAAADRAAEATVSRGRVPSPMQRTDSKGLRNAVLRFSLFVVYF